jgi:hypothetical protein
MGQAPYTYDDIVTSMRQEGWRSDLGNVDVVRMPDGGFTSVDNTRILAAREAGIDVQANIRAFNEPLSKEMAMRFGNPSKGFSPKTWGEVSTNRIIGQGSTFARQNPYGTYNPPRINGRP